MHIFMMPDYRVDNPYQTLLSRALQQEGVTVHFPLGYRRVFPIYRAVKTSPESISGLHLHWLDPYLKGENTVVKLVYCIKFLIDILLTRWAGVKVTWTIHNVVSHNSKFPWLELWTQRRLVRLIDRAIVHHRAAADEVAHHYKLPLSKIEVIPHGHYRSVYQPAIDSVTARQQLGLPKTSKIYLNLGMLKPYKGIERLLQVWKEHQISLGNSILLIVGKALDDRYGQALTEQTSDLKNVILRNRFIEDHQMHLYFSAADVVVLPFERILTSGSLILAMSYDKPVIAPRMGSIPETIGTADGLLYDLSDEQGVLHAIKESMYIDLNKLGQLTHEMCDRLDWGGIAQKTVQVYQSANL